jgi:hypothetical protein
MCIQTRLIRPKLHPSHKQDNWNNLKYERPNYKSSKYMTQEGRQERIHTGALHNMFWMKFILVWGNKMALA